MRQYSLWLLSATAVGSIASSEVPRPRGVGPECPQLPPLLLTIEKLTKVTPNSRKILQRRHELHLYQQSFGSPDYCPSQ